VFDKSPGELLLLAAFVLAFTHFLFGGAATFKWSDGDELAAGAAQLSFLVTGAIATFMLAYGTSIGLWNGLAGMALLLAALALYEWARRTIRDRGFHIAWSGDVPDHLCSDGPYRLIRHPFYLSYMVAFLALLVAMPKLATLAIFLFNIALFTHAAISDERAIAGSGLAEAYAAYRLKTGMLFPRLKGPR
jgi:protein-S-isoprenylcysteine O-methyltransferase Ste14